MGFGFGRDNIEEDQLDLFDEVEDMIEIYGDIISVKFIKYWKFEFHLEVTTDKNRTYILIVGGHKDDVYRYNPLCENWGEHMGTTIQYFAEKPEEQLVILM
jgi:hypothetical protein